MYFSELSDNVREKEAYDSLKQRTLYVLEQIRTGVDRNEEIAEIDKVFLQASKPKVFDGKASVEIIHDKDFEKACVLISQETTLSPKSLSVMEFYSTIEQLKKSAETKTKQRRHGK